MMFCLIVGLPCENFYMISLVSISTLKTESESDTYITIPFSQ